MKTSGHKKILLVAIVAFIFLLGQPFTWAQKSSPIKSKSIKKPSIQQRIPGENNLKKDRRSPSAQVVNSSGVTIYQAKVGNVLFSRHIGSCTDGCSTGFKNVNPGSNIISIKIERDSPWVVLGTLNGFENNKHYAVNLVEGARDGEGCAVLFLRHQTDPTFNSDRTKERLGKTCTIIPDNATKRPPDTQVVNNSGINIHQAKVGNVFFSRYIGSCSDGCSTGFKEIKAGSNTVSVKITPASPWVVIGTLNGFQNNKHYAVNFITGRDGAMCAELWLHHNPDIPFNENPVKERMRGNVCGRSAPIPLRPAD